MSKRVILLGLDFGSTTSSALLASAKVARSATTGHTQLDDVQVIYKSEPVFTPFIEQNIDTEKVAKLIAHWLVESGVSTKDIFSGGSMITGLAAQADNAKALSKLIIEMVGESIIATADDPCLESWLAFMGSCGALSRYHADAPIINFDIGGGTTNIALGVNGDVQATGCYFIGARHFQFVAGGYELTAISSYGEALLNSLNINKKIGDRLNAEEVKIIITFYINALESIVTSNTDFLSSPIAQQHTQVAFNSNQLIHSKTSKPKITFSGGVGELLYKISANEALPTTTFYDDFGIDLASAISRSALLSSHLKTCVPEHKGRATVVGLTLHSTEISGSTVYLPNPSCLPLRDLPIIAKLAADSPTEQWQNAFALAAKRQAGSQTYAACIQITACSNSLEQVRALATQIKHALHTNQYAPSQPIIILVEANIGKALGNYISNWGQLDYNLIVIDEVALRDAHFVHIGRVQQGMIPVSFYGLS
jgi:ethanolamine utilization protein EutA